LPVCRPIITKLRRRHLRATESQLSRPYEPFFDTIGQWPTNGNLTRSPRRRRRPIEEWNPDFTADEYQIPIDGHPNARAHERIADYILSLE
jgi:hypothetical protein